MAKAQKLNQKAKKNRLKDRFKFLVSRQSASCAGLPIG